MMTVRVEFQKAMDHIHEQIIRMGAAVEQSINLAAEALVDMDPVKAQRIVAGDDEIDEMEREIDRLCIRILALQQPVARDLRDVTANLKLITDLERIADHASDIAEHVLTLSKHSFPVSVPHDVVKLSEMAKTMLRGALDSYVSRDKEQASTVIQMDNRIDELFRKLKGHLVYQMTLDTDNIASLVEMLMICNHFERTADHAQNVAEWVLYYIDGRHAVHPY